MTDKDRQQRDDFIPRFVEHAANFDEKEADKDSEKDDK